MNEKQLKAMLASYGRSTLGAVLALYMSGVTDLKTLAYSLFAAVAPVALRALNPNDPAFGRMPATADIADILRKIEVKKPPVRKTSAKKSVAKKKAASKKK